MRSYHFLSQDCTNVIIPPFIIIAKHNATQKLPADDVNRPLYLFSYWNHVRSCVCGTSTS